MTIRIVSGFFPRVAVEADTVTSSDAISRPEFNNGFLLVGF